MCRQSRFSLGRMVLLAMAVLCLIFLFRKMYMVYELEQQIHAATKTKQELLRERAELEEREKALQDPKVIERKARDDLGMVKPGEMPYVR